MYRTVLLSYALALALIAPLPAFGADSDVQMTLQGRPVAAGDYKPADVSELTLRNGLLSITFGSDGSATSLIKDGRELAHNLNGIVPRDPDRHRTSITAEAAEGSWRTSYAWSRTRRMWRTSQ